MLNIKQKSVAILATAVILAAGAGTAAEREIIIFDGIYFPETTHASVGDTIVFNNQSGLTQIVRGNGWNIGPIPNGGTESVEIRNPIQAEFLGRGGDGYSFKGYMNAGVN